MALTTRKDLEELASDYQAGPHVSIYMPVHNTAVHAKENAIRFKNLSSDARRELQTLGFRGAEIDQLTGSIDELVPDPSHWQTGSKGLCLLVNPKRAVSRFLPYSVEQLAVVADRFHVKPLMQLTHELRFFVLAVSQNRVRLFRGTRYGFGELELDDLPESLAEVLKYDDPEEHLQFHAAGASRTGKESLVFHGHGGGEQDREASLRRYLRQIDTGLCELGGAGAEPLVLAGVTHVIAAYREVARYPRIMDEGIQGNPDSTEPEVLHERAIGIVRPLLEEVRAEAARQFRMLLGTGQASDQLQAVVRAACRGRVDSAFVARDTHKWGRYNESKDELEVHEHRQPGEEDLLDLVAAEVLLHGGNVYLTEQEDTPGKASWPLAAVFRY